MTSGPWSLDVDCTLVDGSESLEFRSSNAVACYMPKKTRGVVLVDSKEALPDDALPRMLRRIATGELPIFDPWAGTVEFVPVFAPPGTMTHPAAVPGPRPPPPPPPPPPPATGPAVLTEPVRGDQAQ